MDECPDKKELGERLRMLRKEAGFRSAKAFAESAGFTTTGYTEYEQGRRGLSYENAWKIADALGISLDELGGRQWPPEGASAPEPGEASLISAYRDLSDEGREVAVNVVAGMRSTYPQEPGSHGVDAEEAV